MMNVMQIQDKITVPVNIIGIVLDTSPIHFFKLQFELTTKYSVLKCYCLQFEPDCELNENIQFLYLAFLINKITCCDCRRKRKDVMIDSRIRSNVFLSQDFVAMQQPSGSSVQMVQYNSTGSTELPGDYSFIQRSYSRKPFS